MSDEDRVVDSQGEPEAEARALEAVESLDRDESRRTLHALLFCSEKPLSASRLAQALGDADPQMVETLLTELRDRIAQDLESPYTLREIGGGYQLVTKPEFAPYLRRLLQVKKSRRLSRAVLETLAIIAYKQPVTRAEVEAIRGVSVSHAFDQLLEKRLIKISGVADLPGRPKLFRTTDEFLMQFGLSGLNALPTLDEIKSYG